MKTVILMILMAVLMTGCVGGPSGSAMRGVGHTMNIGDVYVGVVPDKDGTLRIAGNEASGGVIISPIIYGDNASNADKSFKGTAAASVAAGPGSNAGDADVTESDEPEEVKPDLSAELEAEREANRRLSAALQEAREAKEETE